MSAARVHPEITVQRFGDASPVVTVITVANRADVLESCLAPSLREQRDVPFEWIVVHNAAGTYGRAAAALNAAARRATGEVLLFVHQDVRLFGPVWLRELHRWMRGMRDAGVAGVIGRREDGGFAGYIQDRRAVTGVPLSEPVEVQTLDECVLAMPRSFHEAQPFDEAIDGWHVYGVDACLRARRAGLRAYVLPLFIHHDSSSSNYDGLAAAHAAIYQRHGREERTIHTTCGSITSARPSRLAAVRARVVAGARRALQYAGRRIPNRAHALLEEIEERCQNILVLHYAQTVPETVPREVLAAALSPESVTTRVVHHVVITQDTDVREQVRTHAGAQVILLSAPTEAAPGQLKDLFDTAQAIGATILALPDPADADAWRVAVEAAGWQVQVGKGRGSRLLLTLSPDPEAL